jgi:hypothetical protein
MGVGVAGNDTVVLATLQGVCVPRDPIEAWLVIQDRHSF